MKAGAGQQTWDEFTTASRKEFVSGDLGRRACDAVLTFRQVHTVLQYLYVFCNIVVTIPDMSSSEIRAGSLVVWHPQFSLKSAKPSVRCLTRIKWQRESRLRFPAYLFNLFYQGLRSLQNMYRLLPILKSVLQQCIKSLTRRHVLRIFVAMRFLYCHMLG